MASKDRHPLVAYQPLRFLFQLSYIATIIPRLPYYIAVSLIPWFRPHPAWNAKQTFMTRLTYPLLDMRSRIGITETLTLEKRKQGERFQTVAPSTADVYKGPLASESTKPATIGGTWYPGVPSADISSSKTVVLYIHGGAFIQDDGRDKTFGHMAKKLLAKGGADAIFSIQYRLSGYGGVNPYPAALQDSLSAYLFLLNEFHIPASHIVVAGDSAGANLVTALLRYIHEYGAEIGLPAPKCAVLISSWVAPFQYQTAGNPNRGTDFIPSSVPAWGAHTYADWLADPDSDPYVTPLGHPFPTPVPIFASAGSAEMFYEHIQRWVEEMRAVEGNVVELYHEHAAPHDTFLVSELLGFEESAWAVVAKIGEFVRHC
ncbi:hypothetical protein SLS62_002561 [Diatrype stigma]|uniref:Alpha/beta hydrolase fold-3 domain-containing protein n=1 Tax=Diatrype stigma TaxID=117547 RepID=A0AAN9UZT2_9PEZI